MSVGDKHVNPQNAPGGMQLYEETDALANGSTPGAMRVKVVSSGSGTSSNQVQGTAADGAAVVGNPIQVGGKDGSGNAQAIKTDTDGDLQIDVLTQRGAANIANGQATAATASGQVVAARATRRSVLIRNTDAANSAYVGAGTVDAATGFLLKAGESISIETTAAVNSIRATADVVLAFMEVYD